MPLSHVTEADRVLLDHMRQREFNLKKRQRAATAIAHEERRFRFLILLSAALVTALALTAVLFLTHVTFDDARGRGPLLLVGFLAGAVLGLLVGLGFLSTRPGKRLLNDHSAKLRVKYSGDLHAGRRWSQFYYKREDISPFIPQILYSIESERRFSSIDEALAFVKSHAHERTAFLERGLRLFDELAAQTNLAVVSSADAEGRPSSRYMRFVTTERPGIWYVTSAPDAPKAHEFEHGSVAIMTIPDGAGGTISSNRVTIRRADVTFPQIAHLYEQQAPRYLDGMSDEDQAREAVYELTFESARVDSWTDHELAVFTR